ncbi:30S ribosomal protein S15 [Candidatus Purcelliella pentastirinorum]|nr:30S ribosomal protein S15 [Candidatus Purcelliella pentastirinorum]WDI78933.1 30S ribosomal protein S15 [Candidatus Purcelliella pentastirinorum]WDR80068.1 30S ribosomal protein S15 [Candidatus Purcelliella pentastirinorum]
MPLNKEEKFKIINNFKLKNKDTGSSNIQIALLTKKINKLQKHFIKNKKDKHSKYGLLKMISKRKKLLKYIKKTKNEEYKKLIKILKLRH